MIPPLINPFNSKREEIFVPLGLLSLVATIPIHYKCSIYKLKQRLVREEDYQHAALQMLKQKPDVIGFSTWCISYPSSLLLAREINKIAPEVTVIFGGPQASILAQETLETFTFIDFVLAGEADLSFPDFLNETGKTTPDFSSISGLVYRDKEGEIHQNSIGKPIKNLDNLPIPPYELFPSQKTVNLDAGRGCPFRCTYCSTNDFFSKKYRIKSNERILLEMMTVYEKLKVRHFNFAHDMFTLNKKFILELCNKLLVIKKAKGIEFVWTCSARVDCVTDEMLVEMQKAGCQSVFFGIETGSDKIQKNIHKNLDVPRALQLADLCRKINLTMHASFILGFPEETEQNIEETLQCILKLAMRGTVVQASELTLLPGTELYKKYKTELKFDGRFSNFSHTYCSPDELELIVNHPEIFSSFYYLPVNSLERQEIVFLTHMINTMSYFRNTIFLLSGLIENNIRSTDLLQLFKEEYRNTILENNKRKTIVSIWISIIKKYLNNNKAKLNSRYIFDVFNFEAHEALLITLYSGWSLLHQENKTPVIEDDFMIQPTPVWRILNTKYKIEKIIPSENKWEENKSRCREGIYSYLMVAGSDKKCNRKKINSKEVYLLNNLSELSFTEYVKKTKAAVTKREALLWIRKMKRLGVLEIK